jgi:hypothetical protein
VTTAVVLGCAHPATLRTARSQGDVVPKTLDTLDSRPTLCRPRPSTSAVPDGAGLRPNWGAAAAAGRPPTTSCCRTPSAPSSRAWYVPFVCGEKTFVMYADRHHDDQLAFWCAAPASRSEGGGP